MKAAELFLLWHLEVSGVTWKGEGGKVAGVCCWTASGGFGRRFPTFHSGPLCHEIHLEVKGWCIQPWLQEAAACELRAPHAAQGTQLYHHKDRPLADRQATATTHSQTQHSTSDGFLFWKYLWMFLFFTSPLPCGRSLFKSRKYCCTSLLATVFPSYTVPVTAHATRY